MERLEGSFFGHDDIELFYQVWRPDHKSDHNSRGHFLLTHGIGEHSECYHEVATSLVETGWTVYSWDLRGHGRSEGKRGFVRNFKEFRDDLDCFIKHFKSIEGGDGQNRFLFGHSMGGLITLQLLLDSPPQGFQAVVLSSPATGFALAIPGFKKTAAEIFSRWAPKLTMHNEIKYEDLHRDAERLKEYHADPLRHDKISSNLFLGMSEGMQEVFQRAHEIHQPILFQLAGHDKICSTHVAQQVFERLGSKDKSLIVYPDSLHEIYNDHERDQVIHDLKFFLQQHETTG
jgi:alpha-beta hydrolase superfamily lysophospholipase